MIPALMDLSNAQLGLGLAYLLGCLSGAMLAKVLSPDEEKPHGK